MRLRSIIGIAVLLVATSPIAARELALVPSARVAMEATALYDSLGFLTAAQRRSVYTEIQPAQRAELWAIHFKRFLAAHPDLTNDQRAFVFEALGLVSSGVVELRAVNKGEDTASSRAVAHFGERAIKAFPADLYRAAFASLGPTTTPNGSNPWRVRPLSVDCDCNTISDTCPIYSQGCQTATACDWVEEGCGVFGFYWCDGLCW